MRILSLVVPTDGFILARSERVAGEVGGMARRNVDKEEAAGEERGGEEADGGRRFTTAFRMALQNRRAIFFPRAGETRTEEYIRRERPRVAT